MASIPGLDTQRLPAVTADGPAPRFLLLYGSARAQSFSHLLVEEAARILQHLGGETRVFDPSKLPLPDTAPRDHPAVKELHEALLWSDAQFWASPENYGSYSAVLKNQLDWTPPVLDGKPVFQGKPLAVAQVCGAGASFNTSTMMANIGRWLGMYVAGSQLCVPQVQTEFENGRMKPSPHYDKLIDMAEELFKLTQLLRPGRTALLDRYSARAAK